MTPAENAPGLVERLMDGAIPEPNSGCWLWTKGSDLKGYGCLSVAGKKHKAHRLSFVLHRGEVPSGMQVCHRCDVPACINPDHLFAGTGSDNMRDCVRKGRHALQRKPGAFGFALRVAERTHCRHGHLLDERNTRFDKKGARHCRECTRLRSAANRRAAA